MTVLAEFPCLWITPEAVPPAHVFRMQRYLPDVFRVTPEDLEARRDFLSRETASHVLVMPAQVLPGAALPGFQPAPVLLRSGAVIGTMSRSAVTGALVADPGPRLCPRAQLIEHPEIPALGALLPVALAEWVPNSDPESAFRAGHAFGVGLVPMGDDLDHGARAALRASIGSDAPNGRWWMLGLACGLLGRSDCDSAWSDSAAIEDGPALERRLNEVARLVRLKVGFRLHPLTPEQSRCLKVIAPQHPEPAVFEEVAAFCDGLGADGARMARHFREAIPWLWMQGGGGPGLSEDRPPGGLS